MNTFIFEETTFQPDNQRSKAAAFSVGNGYYGCRGFHEESSDDITRLGGIYQAGLFGQGVHEAYDGSLITELLNTPNCLRLRIIADGQTIDLTQVPYEDFYQRLDMARGLFQRGYTALLPNGKKLTLRFERFTHLTHYHLIGQKLTFSADETMDLEVATMLDGAITNLNLESTEPLPIQPGRRHLSLIESGPDFLHLLGDHKELRLAQKSQETFQGAPVTKTFHSENDGLTPANHYRFQLAAAEPVVLTRRIASANNTEGPDYLLALDDYLSQGSYDQLAASQAEAWQQVWQSCDVQLAGSSEMQMALRYNLFHLYSSAPRHDDRLSIGARGLTGEMYEGCIFWDLEIFKLPFFLYQFPEIAKNLLHFRFHTLAAAKAHGKANLFDGAFFPWQVSTSGIEQTQKNVGAFYAIHIVADIAYAINKYMRITNDQEALKDFMAELLIETSRFWVSRVSVSRLYQGYELLAVRGPNEYDVIVNNNCYTNTMAAENLAITVELLSDLAQKDPAAYAALVQKTDLSPQELAHFGEISRNLWIPRDETRDLYLEDEKYLSRREVPMALLKPTAKRVIDSTLPYEALPLYQITKQADVVQLMNLLPENYTDQEKAVNFDFYLPRTAHDSSLSICGYGLMAARLGRDELSAELFTKALFFDMEDRLLNTISGLHFANFGGVWQIAVLGFFGIEAEASHLNLKPKLPNYLKGITTTILYHGNRLKLSLTSEELTIEPLTWSQPCCIKCGDELHELASGTTISWSLA